MDDRHAGIASGVNNAVSRAAQLIAVAALPALAGLTGADYLEPAAFGAGFREAMLFTALAATAGSALAWFGIRDDVLAAPGAPDVVHHRHCPVDGAPYETLSRTAAGGSTLDS